TAKLPDRVVALSAPGQELVAISYDGTRAELTNDGKDKARQALASPELQKAMKEMAPASAGGDIAKKSARPDRMLNFSAATKGKVALAHWGGRLRIVDDLGGVLAEKQMPQDITAMAWAGDLLVVGLADGRVQGLRMR